MEPWRVTTDPMLLRRMGKLSEELGELQSVVARIIIQGVDGIDPASGRCNRARLLDEIADVQAQMRCTIIALDLDEIQIKARSTEKVLQMTAWEFSLTELGNDAADAGRV